MDLATILNHDVVEAIIQVTGAIGDTISAIFNKASTDVNTWSSMWSNANTNIMPNTLATSYPFPGEISQNIITDSASLVNNQVSIPQEGFNSYEDLAKRLNISIRMEILSRKWDESRHVVLKNIGINPRENREDITSQMILKVWPHVYNRTTVSDRFLNKIEFFKD